VDKHVYIIKDTINARARIFNGGIVLWPHNILGRKMTASIVRIEAREEHPNADTLTIYKVSNDLDVDIVQVVANQENVYEVGNSAVYIHPGSVLKDGTKISKRKLRDVMSYGMLVGHSNKPVGFDVTKEYCQEESVPIEIQSTNLKFQKWPSIESFAHVRKTINKYMAMAHQSEYFNTTYAGKIKLHGTNAAVQIAPNGEVVAQKRSSVIYPDQDNAGFATWVSQKKAMFANLAQDKVLTLHGEWCGGNIQKGVALNQIDKTFAIFCVQLGNLGDGSAEYYVDPDNIKDLIGEADGTVWHILPYHHQVDINFYDELSVAVAANEIERAVFEVEACDPWVKYNFDKEGIGEGLVYYPMVKGLVNADTMKEFIFKAKGYKHQVKSNKTPNIVAINIEKVASIQEFTKMFITEARLLQGVNEACGDEYDTKLIGAFLQWISADVMKESIAELEESELTWKDVSKKVMTTAREWYQSKM